MTGSQDRDSTHKEVVMTSGIASRGAASAAVLMAVAAVACSPAAAAPVPGVSRFMTEIVREKLDGDYARAWESLYPAHQRVATRDAYVACESQVPDMGTHVSVRATRVSSERIRVAGSARHIRSKAVRVRVSVLPTGWLVPVVVSQTFHAIPVIGRWTWILSADQFGYYSAATCPYAD
jgi:hypothetical protein